ncbi:efflux RND transporter permease subunit [Alteromonas lipolytica]|uniref:RND transporter n=1 Tax=Alteromonas lipolytica TaxID=1856405 RepID=A0A1E8FEM4_9ALTE|nr:MMPL family transporter [Alteromonas lipolytica]OFI34397.1 RND transporter [Alteromonas lipolytica]GGF81816.1 RND transporter [Alteromonas lipolytica]
MFKSFYQRLMNHPLLIIVLASVFIIAMSIGGKNLYFRGDYKTFFREDNPHRVAFEDMQDHFNKAETVNFLVVPQSGNVFNEKTLDLIKAITEEGWQTPYSIRVNSVTNFQHTYAQQDDLIVDKLYPDWQSLTPEVIENIEKIALSEPDVVNRLVSRDAQVAVVSITVRLNDGDQTLELAEVAAFVKDLKASILTDYPDHEIYLTGVVMLNDAFLLAANEDASTLVPAMFAAIIIMIGILMRSIYAALATLIIVASTIAATMGFAGWAGFFLSVSTVNVPTMVMTLAVADCVHIIASWFQHIKEGYERKEALQKALSLNAMPVIITSVTTSIGFLTLNFSDVPILADLGNLTALGVMLACVFALTLLPSVLVYLPVKPAPSGETKKTTWLTGMGEWVIANHRRVLPYSLVVFIGAIAFASQNQLNDVAIKYFHKDSAFRQAADYQTEHLSGLATIDFAIYTHEISGVNKPEVLNAILDFTNWLRKQPQVDHVSSISDTYKKLNMNMNYDDDAYYALPQDAELAAQYLLLLEMSLPYGLDLNNQVDVDKSASRISVTLDNLGSKELTEFELAAKAYFNSIAPDLTLTAASPALMFAHIGEANMTSMLKGSLTALVIISVLLIFALKSLKLGCISLVPNLLPAGLGFGIWGIISGEINMALSVVLSMTLGIIVDDTVHFLAKYKKARELGKTSEEAVRYAFATIGQALIVTTSVLTVGFIILSMSSFALNSDMGLLTAIILVSALVIDLLFLPAFLLWLDTEKKSAHS